ncbi:hypothetical protein CPB97_004395 [Podila verticillata]|nr:hypothetical protein CPB97_004395 [Podila verticillata]
MHLSPSTEPQSAPKPAKVEIFGGNKQVLSLLTFYWAAFVPTAAKQQEVMSYPSDQYRYGRFYSRGPSFSTTVSTISRTTTTTISTTTTTNPNQGAVTMGAKKLSLRNVGLRFFIHGSRSKLEGLDTEKLMHGYPVIVHQHDYRFEVYGQPQDVAAAITQGVFWPKEHDHGLGDEEEDTGDNGEGHTRTLKNTLGYRGEGGSQSQAQLKRPSHESTSPFTFGASPAPDNVEEDTFTFVAPTLVSHEMHYGDFNESQLRGRVIPAADKWKTDYDMHMDRMERDTRQSHPRPQTQGNSLKELSDPKKESNSDSPSMSDPYALVLSIPSRVMQYLLYETSGLRTYLVEQPSLRDCFLKGYSMQDLENSTDLAVTLECEDLEALRVVLCGIATTFANPHVYDKILESLSPAHRDRRSQWDQRLMVVTETRERDMSSDDQWVITHNTSDNNTRSTTVEVEFEPQETGWSYTDAAELPSERPIQRTPPSQVDLLSSGESGGEPDVPARRPSVGLDVASRRLSGDWGRSSSSMDTIDTQHERNRTPSTVSRPSNHQGTWIHTQMQEMYDNPHHVKSSHRRRTGEVKTPAESESANSFFAD